MPEISVQTADGSKERFALAKARISIGRSRESDIFLPDQWLSRHHAEIQQRGDGYYLLDLKSKNGTLLNGEPLAQERRLRHGDVITLGEHVLTYSAEVGAADEEEDHEPEGTRVFSAKELSDISTKPSIDPEELARQNRVLGILSKAATALVVHRPLSELFEHVLDLLFQAIPAERGAILLLQGEPSLLQIKAARSRSFKPVPLSLKTSIDFTNKVSKVTTANVAGLLPGSDPKLKDEVVIFSAGTGNPFFTTDSAACLRAIEVEADLVLKATKVDGVYTADPFKDPNAEKFERLTYDEVLDRKLGVMDLTAICLCRDHSMPLRVFNMNKPGALLNIVVGGGEGTLIEEGAA